MLPYGVLWGKWLFVALLGGVVLAVWLVLSYLPFWQERPKVEEEMSEDLRQAVPTPTWIGRFMPWSLTFLIAGILIWGLVYMMMNMMHPPNW